MLNSLVNRYKQYNSPATLAELTEFKLRAAGLEDKDDRKLALAAIRKAGYKPVPATFKRVGAAARDTPADAGSSSSSSRPDMSVSVWKPPKRYVNTNYAVRG